MRKILEKNKLILVLAVFSMTIFILFYFLIVPLINEIKNSSSRIQEKLTEDQLKKLRIEKLPEMVEYWEFFQSEKEKAEVILRVENQIGFIEDIESIANETGNEIDLKIGEEMDPKEILKIKKNEGKDNLSEKNILDDISYSNYFPIQIDVRGNYEGLINFIHMIENSHFYINVISIDSKKQKNDESILFSRTDIFSSDFVEQEKKEDNNNYFLNSNIKAIVYIKK